MKFIYHRLTKFTLLAVVLTMAISVSAQRPYRVTDTQVQAVITRIETRTDMFRQQVDRWANRNNQQFRDQIASFVTDFENATDSLSSNFTSRRSSSADVQEVLSRAAVIDQFMRSNRMNNAAQNQWNQIRTDLNILAGYYRVSWNWNNVPTFPTNPNNQAYTVSDRQVQALVNRIETRTDTFKRQVERFDDRRDTQLSEQFSSYVSDFENATNNLTTNISARRSTAADIREVLGRATVIDRFMRTNRVNNAAQNQWNLLRTDLNMLANYYSVAWNWETVPTYPGNADTRVYTGSDSEVQAIFRRVETRTDTFKRQVDRFDNRRDTQLSSQFAAYVSDFENATNSLTNNFTSRRSTSADVQEVLSRAAVIDQFMRNNRVNNAAQNTWNLVRSDLDALAGYYRVSWNWNNVPTFPTNPNTGFGFDSRLTGTYRLNTSLSDNVSAVIERSALTLGNNDNQRDRLRRQLERRLMSPDMLVIEKRGQQITMASSMSQQVSFDADGVSRSETNANGSTFEVRTAVTNNDLTIDYEGDRMNDFHVKFMPMSNGQLRVTRQLHLENRNETISVTSVYDKIDQIARWNNINMQTLPNDTYSNNYPNNGNTSTDFIVANNTRLVAVLDTPLSTRKFNDGDRFTMTVTTPGQYQGAIIEGRVNGTRSGVVSGRANLTLDFDTIRLRNGSTYRFAGIVDQVREPDGDVVSVNNEGTIRDSNQTTKTVTRAGIGAALGAIIGAIAGGGQGAAIGAGIGAGAGAGSVVLQGRDNLELPSGTEFTVTATGYNR